MPFPAQLGTNLADTVDAEGLRMHATDLRQREPITDRTSRWPSRLGGVVIRRAARQFLADRLDPELILARINEINHQLRGRSSSAAKKADALRSIAFALRNS